MKSRILTCIAAMTLFATLAVSVRPWLAAQVQAKEHSSRRKNTPRYKLIDIGTFGGPNSFFNDLSLSDRFGFVGPDGFAQVLNTHGILAGWADTSTPDPNPKFCLIPGFDCFVSHAFQWQKGVKTDLGSLPGGVSSAALWINSNGLIAGFSQNGEIDPLSGLPELRGVVWDNDQITDLGTLGGNVSFALAVNNRGQVLGGAQNATPDPFSFQYQFCCGSSNGTQSRVFLWQNGVMQDVGTLGGPDAAPALVNQRGQVAGFSYINSTPNPTTGLPTFHPFLWEEGKGMKDLGGFGGTVTASVNGLNELGEVVGGLLLLGDVQIHPFLWDGKKLIDLVAPPFGGQANGEASWINEAGEVVGLAGIPASCPPGSFVGPIQHAFLWRNGVITDLGGLAGSPNSEGDFINSKSQIVGLSWTCDFSFTAFLWENGSMVDLNTLVPANSPFLFASSFIDDREEIAAFGLLPNGDVHAVLLIPCHEGDEGCAGAAADAAVRTSRLTVAQRLAIGRMMAGSRARFAQRHHIRGLGTPKN